MPFSRGLLQVPETACTTVVAVYPGRGQTWHYAGNINWEKKMIRLGKALLSLFALFLAMGMLAGCSSSEEESSGGGSEYNRCVDQCSLAPEHQQDECLIACEA